MSSTTQQKPKHLEVEVLSEDARNVLTECGRQLQSAPFKDNGKFEFIDARATLEEASREFVKMQLKPDYRLIAWRFSRAMTLSIPSTVSLDLVPFEVSGTPTIQGIPVKVGNNIHLMKDVEVRPSFICLVRVYGPAS